MILMSDRLAAVTGLFARLSALRQNRRSSAWR
jgi:hypothetical protein